MITAREWILVVRAVGRVLRDSTRLDDIHLVADITSRGRFRRILEGERRAAWAEGLPDERPPLDLAAVDLDVLRTLAPDTLGGAYVRHLDRHGLDRHTTPTSARFIDDLEVRALIYRYRQVHDVWHALLDLGITGHEEVLVHAFTFGQLRLPVSALVLFFGAIKHFALEGRWSALRRGVWACYRSGRDAAPLLRVPWEELWELPIDEVRRRYAVRPAPDDLRVR